MMRKLSVIWEVIGSVLLLLVCVSWGKECTNIPTELSSHTLRSQLLASNNETWKQEMFSHYHLTPTDDSAWGNLLPRKILGRASDDDDFLWAMAYRNMKMSGNRFKPPGGGGGNGSGGSFLKEVSLHDVRLLESSDSVHWLAQQTNLEYLLMLDVDRLVWSFRKTAGVDTPPGKPYGGWESPTIELRGHFVGHYLSASAKMWASTHNDSLKEKMSAVVSALSDCQLKMNTGYLSAFPSELFDRFEAIKPVWAPYYTIHKILAGLLDQYSFAGSSQALKMTTWMVDYFYSRVQNVIVKYSIEQHWRSLNEETGGMNDALYTLYSITGNETHLLLAHLFDKPCFLGLLAVEADSLSGFHVNTHIPVVIGSQMRYEVTGDPLHKEIATFFMGIVNSSHSYATGGTSVDEFWKNPNRLASTLKTENEESCTTYNMLKVSRHLFRWTKEMAYADYYERSLTNGVLGIQRGTEPGKMIYMLPLGHGVSKGQSFHGWGTGDNSFWCCYGTGIESFSKLGDSIYFEEADNQPQLYVTQFISSSFDWKSAQILLNQKVNLVESSDPFLRVTFTFSSKQQVLGEGQSAMLNLRIPDWSSSTGSDAELNGQKIALRPPGTFHSVSVKPGDKLTLQLPITLRIEPIKDDRPEFASIQAILYGPYVLAGLTSDDWDLKTGSATSLSEWITPVPADYNSNLVSFSQDLGNSTYILTNSIRNFTMEKYPEAGTDAAVHATFRMIPVDSKSSTSKKEDSVIGSRVMLEPYDYPGMVVAAQGVEGNLAIGNADDAEGSSVFHLVQGLDGREGTVSLESDSHAGCFVYAGGAKCDAGVAVKLSCNATTTGLPDDSSVHHKGGSFVLEKGVSEYHPISFVATGQKRKFLLVPLYSLRDESYNVYFNIQA